MPRPGTVIVVRKAIPETYTVQDGDSLFEIALKFGMETEELTARNDLDSDHLTPGQRVVLFEREEETEPAVAAAPTVATEEELAEAAQPMTTVQDKGEESTQARLIRVAKKMLSTPYVWGGTSLTGLDCSGFVWKAFAMLNLDLPRSAREQYRIGRNVERNHLSIGDLVFFRTYAKYPSHVGIYLGDNRFIHASSGSRQVKISSMDHPYYEKRYIGAKRPLLGENDVVN
jgi:cell wall-associated NlpC family hydrolase